MKKGEISFSMVLIILGCIVVVAVFFYIASALKNSVPVFTSLADSNLSKENSFFTSENINISVTEKDFCKEENIEDKEYSCEINKNISLTIGLKAISSKSIIVFPRVVILDNNVCDDDFEECKEEDLTIIEGSSCLIFPGEITSCPLKTITLGEGEYRLFPGGRCENTECLNTNSGNYNSKDLVQINPNSFITVSVD